MTNDDLTELIAEGRRALTAPSHERVHLSLVVLPKLVGALDRVALYQHDIKQIRAELTTEVRAMREAMWKADKGMHVPNYSTGIVQKHMVNLTKILDKLEVFIYEHDGR